MSLIAVEATTTKSGHGKAKGTKVVSWPQKVDLQFPVEHIARYLRVGRYTQCVGSGASASLCSPRVHRCSGIGVGWKCRIIPRHIQLPMKNDEELGKLLAHAMISSVGVLPNIHQALLPKKQGGGKSKSKIRSLSQEF
ncbi:hypothetical protein ZIOFF_033128 [Zingiber officinale]|uniref:Histone H2A n=1 Tax=Zingiber officinale TaxID=94328 RepID=A0A8J5GHU4_ZINOF|nr:hypothetical protein ZIOFF_033128 [Zingiber officinale]